MKPWAMWTKFSVFLELLLWRKKPRLNSMSQVYIQFEENETKRKRRDWREEWELAKWWFLNTTVIFKCPDCNAAIDPKEARISFSDALGKKRQTETGTCPCKEVNQIRPRSARAENGGDPQEARLEAKEEQITQGLQVRERSLMYRLGDVTTGF